MSFRAFLLAIILVCPNLLKAEQYLSFQQVLSWGFDPGVKVERFRPQPTPEQQRAVMTAARVGGNIKASLRGVYLGQRSGQVEAVMYIDAVVGRTEYITYAALIDAEDRIRRVVVMEYREPYGGEVRFPQFTDQFIGRVPEQPLRLKREIRNIAGATLSCRGMTERLRFLMHYHKEVVRPQVVMSVHAANKLGQSAVVGSAVLRITGSDQAESLLAQAVDWDQQWNAWRADGTWTQAGKRTLNDSQREIVISADYWFKQSKGLFDPTIRPALWLWWQAVAAGRTPSAKQLAAVRNRVGWTRILYDEASAVLQIPRGMQLDFGGLRKGLLLDQLELQTGVVMDYGGSSWRVGSDTRVAVRDPMEPESVWQEILIPAGYALAVSGGVSRSMRITDTLYSQLVDPRTMQAIPTDRAAVVIAPKAVTADVLASVLCLANGEEDLPDLNHHGAWGWCFVAGEWQQIGQHPPSED